MAVRQWYVTRSPHEWTPEEQQDAFSYFVDFYGSDGIHPAFITPPPDFDEFMAAVRHDFDAWAKGEVENPLFGSRWEFCSVERERIRDRLRMARGVEPIGYRGGGLADWTPLDCVTPSVKGKPHDPPRLP